jgi:hypothetical protein
MADVILTQAEADALIAMEKHRVNEDRSDFPMGGESVVLPLQSADKREQFLVDLGRGRIFEEGQNAEPRAPGCRVGEARSRWCAPSEPGRGGNPGSPSSPLPRGFGDKWAVAVPRDRFRKIADVWTTLEDFMRFCNIM